MISPYMARLLLLSLACFFLVNLAASAVIGVLLRPALRVASRRMPPDAARLMLGLRMFPAAAALVAVGAFCVPSYFWLEPDGGFEAVGFWCMAAASLGATICVTAVFRTLRAFIRSYRAVNEWRKSASRMKVAGQDCLITAEQGALIALAGFVRSRLVVSEAVVSALSRDELDAAIRHECAHGASRDNIKRLLALLAPDPVPFLRPFSVLDRGWTMFSEWAADDAAVAGDARRSLSLAAALVRVARLSAERQPALASALIPEQRCVAARVERLLSPAPPCAASGRRGRLALAATIVCGAAVLFAPAMLKSAHAVLEQLMR